MRLVLSHKFRLEDVVEDGFVFVSPEGDARMILKEGKYVDVQADVTIFFSIRDGLPRFKYAKKSWNEGRRIDLLETRGVMTPSLFVGA